MKSVITVWYIRRSNRQQSLNEPEQCIRSVAEGKACCRPANLRQQRELIRSAREVVAETVQRGKQVNFMIVADQRAWRWMLRRVSWLSDRFAAMWLTARINRNGEPARQNTARLQAVMIMRIMYIMLNKVFNSFFQPASLLADLNALTKRRLPWPSHANYQLSSLR